MLVDDKVEKSQISQMLLLVIRKQSKALRIIETMVTDDVTHVVEGLRSHWGRIGIPALKIEKVAAEIIYMKRRK